MSDSSGGGSGDVTVRIGHEEIVLRHRYEVASIANDVLIALWFTVGSALFFDEATFTAATWCFLLGSIQFMVRPVLRLGRRVHVQRTRGPSDRRPSDLADDY